MTAEGTATCEACDAYHAWAYAQQYGHFTFADVQRFHHALIRALKEERDGYKLAAETQVEAVVLAAKEWDGLRAALEASAEFFASDTHEHCCAAMDEVQAKVRAALYGEGKKP